MARLRVAVKLGLYVKIWKGESILRGGKFFLGVKSLRGVTKLKRAVAETKISRGLQI